MFKSLLLVGCIVFFCIVVYGLQMILRLNTKYPTGCKVTYYPEKRNINDAISITFFSIYSGPFI